MSDSTEPGTESSPYSRPDSSPGEQFERLVELMRRLRGPGGCPWDREQDFDSIKPYTLEETYEVLDRIDARDWPGLAEELGDLMLQAVFYAQMASEEGLFTITDTLEAINGKLVRRHPHVFGEAKAETAAEVKERWDQIKAREKAEKPGQKQRLLDSVPRGQPALAEAQQVSSKAAGVGFDWPDTAGVLEKVQEEIREIEEARGESAEKLEEEIGDLLFAVVNLARHGRVDAEQALRRANAKFRERFSHVESSLAGQGRGLEQATLEEMEELWQAAKGKH